MRPLRASSFAEATGAIRLDSAERLARWGRRALGHLDHEEVWLAALSGSFELVQWLRVGRGDRTSARVDVPELFRRVLERRARAFAIVHNHPAGSLRPSREDIAMTERLCVAGLAIGVPMLDHVIVSRRGSFSLLAPRRGRWRYREPKASERASG